ncbi:MAG: hypothetical protein PVI15_00745 [Chromatiales bacterium]|jgi:hypothetical protein
MHTVILKGRDAVNYAGNHQGIAIHEIDAEGHDHTVSLDEARRLADIEPDSLWVEIQAHINSAD